MDEHLEEQSKLLKSIHDQQKDKAEEELKQQRQRKISRRPIPFMS